MPERRSSAIRRIVRIGTMKSVKIQKNVFVNIRERNRSCGAPGAERNTMMREKM